MKTLMQGRWTAFLLLAILVGAGSAWAVATLVPQDQKLWFRNGIVILPNSQRAQAAGAALTANTITRSLGASATIDFASTTTGVVLSSSITVTGAQVGDPCFVGVPTAAAALKATFGCYVDAADSVKVWFSPRGADHSACTLGGQSPAICTATVTAGAVCTCSLVGATAAIAAKGCAVGVSSTTLTVTSANAATEVANFDCLAPVDPASGTYYVRVASSQ